ncbi:3-carboxy-cis,cis-muconate cycloisomerase [Rhizobium sp. Root274]|uniref:3-carboxy-cis,cis-muconate cycloisomerase n=1 Tax=unclassified Rhizobium TaxID=2613769 RepID=UPI00071271E5|nr:MULTISPECIES: 3-carboxy-cis,cis-muconate cycloisomerase [unclassified Rhizobium]KQW29541.1 3-carboxy-cis,cis-muconate cycloisomerase [Rhizobium sp. Root1240]KRD29733.1 3-carboxy-cis,cis-muconate cycloisomerase [Rhizobium sp. Root274]
MTASVFDHPILFGLLGDQEVAGQFTAAAELQAMLAFEVALANAEAEEGLIPKAAAQAIAGLAEHFVADLDALNQATARDGVVIPDLVRQWRAALGEHASHLHFGATSQDAIDSGLMLRLVEVLRILTQRLATIIVALDALETRFGPQPLMGKTRMQAAIEITIADRIAAWRLPLVELREAIAVFAATGLPVQFGGAAGTLEKLGASAVPVRARLAAELGLADRSQWHSQRGIITELGGLFARITGSLGKAGQDLALMADAGTAILGGGGASSAMPHKRNPVKAEVLVTLARFNAVQISGLYQSMVHEQERSGAAWTLEWMLLPQMAIAAGASTRIAGELFGSVERLGEA